MSHTVSVGLALAIATAPLLIACGGGKADAPGAINVPQCSGASCGVQGPPAQGAGAAALCPATGDIGSSTYLGGAGSGEIVSLNINATAMTYTLKWWESPIPLTTGTVSPTRAGVTITGNVAHPPTGTLPTAEQTRCAFILEPGSGTAPGGGTYSTAASFNTSNPPMVLVGLGVAGGGIPGATVQFSGVSILGLGTGVGQVPNRQFDFYPFLGFASTTTDISKLPGTYNGLLYHITPSGNYLTAGANSTETFDANGACTSTTRCLTTGNPWTAGSNGYFTSTQAPQISAQTLPLGISASAHMVLGQVNGATVPLVVRTGNVNLGALQADDESGIALLAKNTAIASGGFDGGYVGADSNFKYTATLIQGGVGTFINPTTAANEDGFALNYGLSTPGLIGVTDTRGQSGFAIASGGLYAILINDTMNGGLASGGTWSSNPYFGVGAQISK